jgi:hypothetical protein
MSAPLDMAGRRFNRLTGLHVVRHRGVRAWAFRCDCGKETVAVASDVTTGKVKSCGCLRNEKTAERSRILKRLGPGVARFRQVLKHYTDRARRDGLAWALSELQARSLMEKPCTYCGAPPSNVNRAPRGWWGEFIWNGIDRINSSGGYVPSNCVPCCSKCNYMKAELTVVEFIEHVTRIVEHAKGTQHGQGKDQATAEPPDDGEEVDQRGGSCG